MAIEGDCGGDGALFVGEDKILRLIVVDENDVPVDTVLWTSVKFFVRKQDKTPDPAIFDKDATRIGVYNADPAVNTQMWEVSLTDTELNTIKAKTYRYSWKRMDDGGETVLRYGNFIAQLATAR